MVDIKTLQKQKSSAKAVAYIRVSTDKQVLGQEAQLAEIVTWAEFNKINLVQVIHDPGISGDTEIEKRTELLSAISSVGEQEADFLVVSKLDRIARDLMVQLWVEKSLAKVKARVISATENPFQEQTPEQVLLRNIMGVMGQYELSLIRSRTQKALAAAKAKGRRLGRPGYLKSDYGRQIIHVVRALRKEGKSGAYIQRYLNEHYTPLYGKTFHLTQIQRWIKVINDETLDKELAVQASNDV